MSEKEKKISKGLRKICAAILAFSITMGGIGTEQIYAAEKKAPDVSANSVLLYCENTDEVVYEKNSDEKMEPYSTTNLMTALLTVEQIDDLDRKVTVSKKASEYGGSTMDLKEGEVVTVEQLLYGMLILSGNDAAYALAETVSDGNVKSFIKQMNEKAEELGCEHTHFMNPNGIKEEGHYTTAEDYLLVGQAALSNKKIKKIAGTKKYKMPATNKSEARTMKTHTDLLNKKNSGVIAGKTGRWDDDSTIVLRYDKKDLELTLVLFGTDIEERPDDVKEALKFGAKTVKGKKAVKKGEKIKKAFVQHGEQTIVDVYAEENAYVYQKKNSKDKVKTKAVVDKHLKAPLKKGDRVGKVKVLVKGKEVSDSPLIVQKDIKEGWIPSYLYLSNRGFLIFLGIAAAFLLIRHHKRKKKSKKVQKLQEKKSSEEKEYVPKH